jgi:hypothetical protein
VYSGGNEALLYAIDADSHNGLEVSCAVIRDFNQDGGNDYLVGAWMDDTAGTDAGKVELIFGVDGSVLCTFLGSAPSDLLGFRIAPLGDTNGDGISDFALLAKDFGSPSRIMVYQGATALLLHSIVEDPSSGAGRTFSGAGDVNADGYAHIVVGVYDDDSHIAGAGNIRILSGFDGSLLCSVFGQSAGDCLGSDFAVACDINGDGYDD